ncbi:Sterile alpha motif (SAM) domain-containing protein [Zea mays]|uniref:Sterile alpha motif (SAM) domain-containing protein n=1 Tax=Zea mays TaxID=4577 RepID=A0A1D6J897_MAIZE|nr:Sterile alpha motif (SAM) domain-containing protein [Zea mays]
MASSSASSRHQVTITLGRSGQVVKRRTISDDINGDEMPLSGKKRSVRDRLGSNVSDSDFYGSQQRNKRQQTEINSSHGDDGSDRLVGKDDLRLKLMRKGSFQRSNGGAEQNTMDLREKLSRNHKKLPRYDSRGHAAESRASYDMRDEPPELRSRYFSREDVLGSRNSSVAEAPLTVTGLLNSLGLEKYIVLFQAEEVDMAALRQMGESDLKDMGVPMGRSRSQKKV